MLLKSLLKAPEGLIEVLKELEDFLKWVVAVIIVLVAVVV
jgi:hypothetical protein